MGNITPKFVGLIGALEVLQGRMKPQLLIFDSLAIPGLESLIRMWKQLSNAKRWHLIDELELLKAHGIVFDAGDIPEGLTIQSPEAAAIWEEGERIADTLINDATPTGIAQMMGLTYRILALKLREIDGYEVVPVTTLTEEVFFLASGLAKTKRNLTEVRCTKADVLRIVLSVLPEPVVETPYENILEFRKDESARVAYARLRVWMSQLAKGGLSSVEVAEMLESALADYESYMHLYEMKTTRNRMEAFVMTAAEVLESVASLKFSKAAKLLFDLSSAKLDLMEAELRAPGREVAYLSLARHRVASPE